MVFVVRWWTLLIQYILFVASLQSSVYHEYFSPWRGPLSGKAKEWHNHTVNRSYLLFPFIANGLQMVSCVAPNIRVSRIVPPSARPTFLEAEEWHYPVNFKHSFPEGPAAAAPGKWSEKHNASASQSHSGSRGLIKGRAAALCVAITGKGRKNTNVDGSWLPVNGSDVMDM